MLPTDDFALITIQCQALYRCDRAGRLLGVNEPDAAGELPLAPRFFLARTRRGNLWRFRHDLPTALIEELEALCRVEPTVAAPQPKEWREPARQAVAIRAALRAHAPISDEYRGPAYWIPPQAALSAQVVLITEANAACLQPWFAKFLPLPPLAQRGVVSATVVEGVAVAICHCARLTPVAAEAGVETAAAFRGKGHASAAVAGWAEAIRGTGRLPLYSTWWENLASQGVARRLGMVMYGEDWSLG